MTDPRYYSDPKRPANETPGSWYRKCREKEAAEEAAAEWRRDFKKMLARVNAKRGDDGPAVCRMLVAVAGDDIPLEEMERIGGILPVERSAPQPIRSVPVVEHRLPSAQAEASWLKEARLAAEADWRAAFPQTAPQRNIRSLSAEDIALAQSFGELAQRAADLVRDPDSGQKIYRHDRIDETDIDLFQRGAAAAKRLWPGI